MTPLHANGRLCHECQAPLVLLLSDAAGSLYGCTRCRNVDLRPEPPATRQWTETRRLTPRQRRQRARLHGRRGVRVSASEVVRRAAETGWLLIRRETAAAYGLTGEDVVPGWVLALWERAALVPVDMRWPEDVGPAWLDQQPTAASVKHATISRYASAGVLFFADDTAPDHVLRVAADRLRVGRVGRAYAALRALCD